MKNDPTQAFLSSLPEIGPDEQFWFACHPDVPCFNACCSDLNMPLMPYDVLRLCTGLSMSSEEFFESFAIPGCWEDTGFPRVHLRMEADPNRSCPFLTERGCGVYGHRSSACRTYPLGRAVRVRDGVDARAHSVLLPLEEQFFLVREDHCKGFAENVARTIAEWREDQGLAAYYEMNDRYMQLIARYKAHADGAILSSKHATMALLCLYQQDRFAEFIGSVGLTARVTFQGRWAGIPEEEIVRTIKEDAEQRLRFGFDWLELVLLGDCADLAPAG